jgi:hypothetical protein
MRRLNLIYIPSICIAAFSFAACTGTANSDATSSPKETATATAARPAPAPPVEQFREVTIPVGTTLAASLDEGVGSATSRVDEPVHAHLTSPVSVDGVVALPAGSVLSGAVVDAEHSKRVKGRAEIAIRFDSVRPVNGGETYAIRTNEITREARGQMKKDAMKVGIPAGVGAVVGGLLGGGKGAAIGAGVGGGGGAAYVMSQKGPEVGIGRGAALSVRLLEPIRVRVRTSPEPVAAN